MLVEIPDIRFIAKGNSVPLNAELVALEEDLLRELANRFGLRDVPDSWR